MKKAQSAAVRIALDIVRRLRLEPGQSELEIARWIKKELKAAGARPAFRIIVASGKRSALPHGRATRRKIAPGEFVVVDFGALYNGYCSDITRTFAVGKLSSRQEKVFSIVEKARERAIALVKAGRSCREVDLAARNFIDKRGFGKYFIHTTGHGVGRKVHEAPKISKRNRRKLKAGQIITIEPGIYIKGWGGVRIEDMVRVTKSGCQVLTR